jgi:glutamate dehydrogenase
MSTHSPLSPLNDKAHLQPPDKGLYFSDPSSGSASDVSLHRIKNLPGYTTPVFKGKEEQRAKVQDNVAAKVRAYLLLKPIADPHFF